MARAPRIAVPALEDVTSVLPDERPFLAEEFPDTPDPQTEAELDDILQLAQVSYNDWTWYGYRYKSADEMLRDPRGKGRGEGQASVLVVFVILVDLKLQGLGDTGGEIGAAAVLEG